LSETIKVDLGDLSNLDDGDVVPCRAGEWEVAVCRVKGALYAIEDLCSHAETTLSDGLLTGYSLVCPLHGASFDVRTGEHSGPPAWCGVAAFTVTESDDGTAVVEVPATHGASAADGAYDGPQTEFRTR
jgi:3-phenylpropionate/trans-cinnamate dioxygenase ferredoxin component